MSDYSIKCARAWAQGARSSASLVEREAAQALLDLLPEPTLGEIGFNFDAHHLAGATTPGGEEVVMMWLDTAEDGLVMCDNYAWAPGQLTPNGKRYEIREVGDLPGYQPEKKPGTNSWLLAAEEAEDAPEGTIIAKNGSEPYIMDDDLGWVTITGEATHEHIAANLPWRVLRWGWRL